MNVKERYEEFRAEYSDIARKAWEDLTESEQCAWARLLVSIDNKKKVTSKALETVGRVILACPDILPVLEV